MMHLAFDLRDAARTLRRDRGYSLTSVLTLALTIGGTTAVFSIVDGVLLKPLAYPEAHRMVDLREVWRQVAWVPSLEVNEQHFEYWRQHARSFESMAQYIPLSANLTGLGDAVQITVVHASSSIFDLFGVRPARGRSFTQEDERAGQPAVALIADAFWRRRLNGDPSVIGESIALDGVPHLVIGVLPPDFQLPYNHRRTAEADAFVPIRLDDDRVGWVGDHNNAAIGRLRTGVTLEQAQAELDVLQRQVSVRAAADAHEPVTLGSLVRPLAQSIVGDSRRGLLLLLGAILAVLLIACANLANLGLTRTTAGLRDAAIRAALGAGPSRLLSRALLDTLLLAGIGGSIAIWIASTALSVFVRTAPLDIPRLREIALDGRVLAFSAALSIVTGLLIGILPAWRISCADVEASLRSGSGTLTANPRSMRVRAMLLGVQVAMSMTLLVVTGLLIASFVRLMRVDKGFTPNRVLAISVALPEERYASEQLRLAAYDRLITGVQSLPGVAAVTTTSLLPLRGEGQINFIAAQGDPRPRSSWPAANFRFIAPEFFQTLQIRIERGRSFSGRDRASSYPVPAVVSESAAAQLWPRQDPIGRTFSRGQSNEPPLEVVGVAADARTTSLVGSPPLMVYVPYWWHSPAANRTKTSLLIKTGQDPSSLVSMVRRLVRLIDPDIAIGDARPLTDLVDAAVAPRRYQTGLFVAFGGLALVIAMVGVYGVAAYGVARRQHEMNIRVALGADTSRVLGMIVREAALPVGMGLAAGVLGAVALGNVLAGVLFEVQSRDPGIIAAVAATIGCASMTSTLAAARRGLSIDPAAALRQE